MRKLLLLLIGGILFWGCKKDSGDNNDNRLSIDVSGQCYKDFAGNDLTNSGVCSGTFFNSNELALFKTMDTVSLNNTAKPELVQGINLYPNPFTTNLILSAPLSETFNGKVVLKYVIVNSELNILQKNYVKNFMRGSQINLFVNLSSGKYRLYMTLSSENNINFYTKWINIQVQ